ncbi:unnamed protein product, partial [Gordionus sp. m RMFG-2023]
IMPSLRRNVPGTKAADFYKWEDQPFEEMDSTLSYQQLIQQSIRKNPHDIKTILKMPANLDPNKDAGIWKYEHIRQFCLELNSLFIKLQDICFSNECSQMTATSQCIYLCAAHKTPKECPAIIYTRHTLDGASSLLNNNKYFPSRVNFKESSLNKLESICRRIYRIFGHAYYHHRNCYEEFEAKTSLCERFTVFVTEQTLMPLDNIIVPVKNFEISTIDSNLTRENNHDTVKPNSGGLYQIHSDHLDETLDMNHTQDETEVSSSDSSSIASQIELIDNLTVKHMHHNGVNGSLEENDDLPKEDDRHKIDHPPATDILTVSPTINNNCDDIQVIFHNSIANNVNNRPSQIHTKIIESTTNITPKSTSPIKKHNPNSPNLANSKTSVNSTNNVNSITSNISKKKAGSPLHGNPSSRKTSSIHVLASSPNNPSKKGLSTKIEKLIDSSNHNAHLKNKNSSVVSNSGSAGGKGLSTNTVANLNNTTNGEDKNALDETLST